jgi:hypothetical protein
MEARLGKRERAGVRAIAAPGHEDGLPLDRHKPPLKFKHPKRLRHTFRDKSPFSVTFQANLKYS